MVGLVVKTANTLSKKMTHELRNLGLLGVASLLLCIAALVIIETGYFAIQWAIVALTFWAYVWMQCWQRRNMNRACESSPLYETLGFANRLTLLRGLLIAMTAGFIFQHYNDPLTIWIPAFLYSVAAILDRVDGFVARRTQHSSLMGSALDNAYDALGLLVAPVLAVQLGKVHWSYLLLSVAYYAFHIGLARRQRQQLPVFTLVPSKLRRTLAGFQMGYVAVALWPPFDAQITSATGMGFMLPVLLGFVFDWGIVSGRISTSQTQHAFTTLRIFSHRYFQPSLRVVFAMLLVATFWATNMDALSATFVAFAAALVILGCGARIGSVIVLLVLALQTTNQELSPAVLGLLIISSWIALLGSGRFSVWQGDDVWVERHDGAL